MSKSHSSRPDDCTYVQIARIHVSAKDRRRINAAKVDRYARLYEAGRDFPPIVVLANSDFYVVRDGRHRLAAQIEAGFTAVPVRIINPVTSVAGF
jgi:ParB-like chromosome segregation protein Spo0J